MTRLSVIKKNEKRSFTHKRLPEIYQVEVTTACQLKCGMCHRHETTAARGGNQHLEPGELAQWIDRGDFAGSYFVELQMSGEPLLHPDLLSVTSLLKNAGLLVGMSTNGLLLDQRSDFIEGLDSITVSIDSSDPEEYAKRRPFTRDGNAGALGEVFRNVDALLKNHHCPPFVDIQILAPLSWAKERIVKEEGELRERFQDDRVTVRHIVDNTAVRFGRDSFEVKQELCINPWMSVSVQADGTVVSCCYVWDRTEQNTYGNLNEDSLSDIWEGDAVKNMREAQRCGEAGGLCPTCYFRSPSLIHLGFLPSWVSR